MTTTIAERHKLERGDICAIEILVPAMGETVTRFGRYHYTSEGKLHFHRPGNAPLIYAEDRIRSIRKVTPEYVASQYSVDQTVIVRKYGGDYDGQVTKVGRTRLTVTFLTRAGVRKTQTFSAIDVAAPWR